MPAHSLRALASLVVACAGGAPLFAQEVKVEAKLSAPRISVGEVTVLQVSIETGGDNADPVGTPRLPRGLEITGSQEFSQLQTDLRNGRSRLIRRDIIIRAHLPGDYVIPSLAVRVRGITHHTPELLLHVSPRPTARPRFVSGRDEVMLRAWLEPDTVYVGEQVLLNAEALFPRDLRRRQSRPASYEAPTPANFWIQDLPDAISTGIRSVNGTMYETQTFRRVYFPLTAGTHTIPPARLVYEIRRGFLYAPESRELVSDSLHVVVRPLPETGRPASFTGAVGRYTMAARLEPERVGQGEAATLTIEIRGVGNVKALPPPGLPELGGFEVFSPTEESRIENSEDEIGGTKRFLWVLIPQQSGRLEVPPINYGFFDPVKREYRVVRSDPLELSVLPERGVGSASGSGTSLHYIAFEPGNNYLGWVRSPLFAALQTVPLLALLGAAMVHRGRNGRRSRRSRRQLRAAIEAGFNALTRAVKSDDPDRVFFADFATIVREALADLLARPDLRTAARETIIQALREPGASDETVAALDTLLQRIDHARFASVTTMSGKRATMLDDARRVLDDIAREVWPEPANGGNTVAMLMLCLVPAVAHAQWVTKAFESGVVAFQQERYADAASSFTDHVQKQRRDANGWYNLGNSYLRMERRGHAVWAWLRAVDIQPRHISARHNLSAVAPQDAIEKLPPIYTLSPDEAMLAIAAIWWYAGISLAGSIVRRRRPGLVRLACAIALALAAAAAALYPILPGPTAVALEKNSPLLAGPSLKADQLAILEDGTPVTILERRNAWWRVRSASRHEGWVEAALFAEVR